MTNALTLFGEILPQGGLAALKHEDLIFDSSAPEVLARLGVDSKQKLLSAYLALQIFENPHIAKDVLVCGMKDGHINKDDLITLYSAQSPEKRALRPLITLENIWEICCHARVSEKDEPLITKETIIELANRYVEVNASDVEMFMMQWFYRGDENPLSEDFLVHWYKESGHLHSPCGGKCASLVAIRLHEVNPNQVKLNEVIQRFADLARTNPYDHGIHRYLWLAMSIAGEDVKQRRSVIDKWIEATESQINAGVSGEQQAEFSIGMLASSTDLTAQEKHRALMKLHDYVDERVQSLQTLIKRTLKK
jgi:hypothetical protein